MDNSIRHLNDCGCCEGLTAETPALVFNRPGLSVIVYRVGAHAQFKQSLLAGLSDSRRPGLKTLNTRDDDDFSIALLDAWATVADVLTFYQERLANESYLRTATERLSLLQLARLIGYELRPGVAAGAYLAFIIEEPRDLPPVHTTIDIGTKVQSVPGPDEKPQTFETIEKIEARTEWNALKPKTTELKIPNQMGVTEVYLKGTATNLKLGDALLFVGAEREGTATNNKWDFRRVKEITTDDKANHTKVTLDSGLGSTSPFKLPAANPKVYALRLRAALFGHNAPDPKLLHASTRKLYVNSGQLSATTLEWIFTISGQTIYLDAVYSGIVPKSWLVLSKPTYQELYRAVTVAEASPKKYTLTSKSTQITLDTNVNLHLYDGSDYRATVVFAQSEELTLAKQPDETPVGHVDYVVLNQIVEGLTAGRQVIISGIDTTTGKTVSQVMKLKQIEQVGSFTKLVFTGIPHNVYRRDSVTINANVARATHGETVQEVLGSGDASQPYQRFALRQPPLTHISASTASGTESTLQVRVNDILWRETPTLYGHAPNDRVYIARRDNDGKTTIQFGDGRTGSRLPSGQENVRATYRKGIGLAGNVKTDQLSTLMTRPFGVKGVTNPQAAGGGDDAESLDGARQNAPLTVLTLERTVSLRDYEDFTRAYAGIAKALATWTLEKGERRVFITVAGPHGAAVLATSELYQNLLAALKQAGDPHVRFSVKSFRQAYFRLAVRVKVHPDYLPEKVLAAVDQALRLQFSFESRAFGQPVILSEVIAVIQAVAGVEAVDVDKLYRAGRSAILNHRLLAALPETGADGEVAAAELLTLHPEPLAALEVMP